MTQLEGVETKIWFIFVGDHHEGPISVREVWQKLADSTITPQHFVWREGLKDWQPLEKTPELQAHQQSSDQKSGTDPRIEPILNIQAEEPKETQQPAPQVETPVETEEKTPPTPSPMDLLQNRVRGRISKTLKIFGLFLALICTVATVLFLGKIGPLESQPKFFNVIQPLRFKALDRFSFLEPLVHPLPPISSDVTPEDFSDLKSAAIFGYEKVGLKVSIGLSLTQPQNPSFYISANFPDSTVFEIYLDGVKNSLLNELQFSAKTTATIQNRLGKSAPLTTNDGRTIPKGQYWVYVTLPGDASQDLPATPLSLEKVPEILPKNTRLLAKKLFFLGGPKDELYNSRLKEFHEKIKEKILAELQELKQLQMTLGAQLESTKTQYEELKKLKSQQAKKMKWKSFQENWQKLQAGISSSLTRYEEPETLAATIHRSLFKLLNEASLSVAELHDLQSRSIDPKLGYKQKTELSGAPLAIREALLFAETQVGSAKTRVDEAQNSPLTPGGP